MDRLKFITEQYMDDFKVITEQSNASTEKQFKIVGPYMLMNTKNQNNRIYPESITIPAVEDYIEKCVKTRSALGELNHPKSLQIDYDRVCHKVVSLKREGNYYIGESVVLHGKGFPKGDILYGLLSNDIRVGISSRGAGKDYNGVLQRYILKSFDIVSDPSGFDCFVDPILESKEYMINEHGELVEYAYNKLEQNLQSLPLYTEERKRFIVNSLKEFINSL